MSSLPPPVLFDPKQHSSDEIFQALAQIHADCVLQDGTLATFLPRNGVMDMARLEAYWRQRAEQVVQGQREIILQFANTDDGKIELAGYVSLSMSSSETGPFRGEVEKLLVSPRHRRKGVAKRVMDLLDQTAKERRTELLILDTTIGTPAEQLYPKLGYKYLGVIPKYGIGPKTGNLVDEIFYYKDLRDEE